MRFVLRQVSRRAAGGDLERIRPLAAATPTIGRGADCDIRLTDLAVSLRHAQLSGLGDGVVLIQAAPGCDVEVGTRFVEQARLVVADAPEVRIGDQILTLTVGADPDEVIVTVAAEETASTAAALPARDPFTLASATLSKRSLAWTLGGLIIAVCLAWPIIGFLTGPRHGSIHPDQQWLTTPLSKAHAFLGDDCKACHQQAFVAVRDTACIACHDARRDVSSKARVAANLRFTRAPARPVLIFAHAAPDRLSRSAPNPRGLEQQVGATFSRAFNHPDDRCATCHLEHIPRQPGPQFAEASGPLPTLTTANACADCHARLKSALPDTPLLDTASWSRHPDFRPLITLAAGPRPRIERIDLSRGPRENSGLIFSHQLHLSPTGGVARMSQVLGPARRYGSPLTCANCHHADASGRGFLPVGMERDCSACHSLAFSRTGGVLNLLPHGRPDRVVTKLRDFYAAGGQATLSLAERGRTLPGAVAMKRLADLAASARIVTNAQVVAGVTKAFSRGGPCFDCHTVVPPVRDSISFDIAPVRLTQRFLPRGDFNHAIAEHRRRPNGEARCADCHKAAGSVAASDVMLPRIDQCASCHGATKAQTRTPASSDCRECHSYHAPGAATVKRYRTAA